MKKEFFYVYILANKNDTVLYIGITNNLERRVSEHKQGLTAGFTKKYNCEKLIFYETYNDPKNAIAREKQLKKWSRNKKQQLVNSQNETWNDLSLEWE